MVRQARVRQLPVFRARPRGFSKLLQPFVAQLFGTQSVDQVDREDYVEFRSGSKLLEVDQSTSALWFTDTSRLWLPTPPNSVSALPPPGSTARAADHVIAQLGKPWTDWPADIRREAVPESGTMMVITDDPSSCPNATAIDRYAASRFLLTVENPFGPGRIDVPIVGRTAKASLTMGPGSQIVGFTYSWWDLDRVDDRDVIAPAFAMEKFIPQSSSWLVTGFSSSLAYREVELSPGEFWLVPVWILTPTALLSGQPQQMMCVEAPATDVWPDQDPEPKQTRDETATMPASPSPPKGFRYGLSWIGSSGGLGGAHRHVTRLETALRAGGWTCGFSWGNLTAHQDDWHKHNAEWVNAVELAYFSGHAASDSWVLESPTHMKVQVSDVGVATGHGLLYGYDRLRWIVLNACGPFQDPSTGDTTGSCAITRWAEIFDGVRVVMGGASKLCVNDDVGERFASLACRTASRVPLIEAWFRANRECRPSTVGTTPSWVAALYIIPAESNEDPRMDVLPTPARPSAPARLQRPGRFVGLWSPV